MKSSVTKPVTAVEQCQVKSRKIVFLTCIPARGSFEVDTPIINTDISTKKSVTMKQSLKKSLQS